MAEDNAAFLRALDLAPAHLVGWSDGAAVGLLTVWRYPELVPQAALYRTEHDPRWVAAAGSGDGRAVRRADAADAGADVCGGITRQPGALQGGLDRLRSSWTSDLALSMVRLGEVSTPTLVMMGDGDIPSVEHAGNIYGRLADAQLAIVPGTSHALTMEKPDLVTG
jgi:pimeloyl-ACP methyl ester carboxylesterase